MGEVIIGILNNIIHSFLGKAQDITREPTHVYKPEK
jgi:hypothetical protein